MINLDDTYVNNKTYLEIYFFVYLVIIHFLACDVFRLSTRTATGIVALGGTQHSLDQEVARTQSGPRGAWVNLLIDINDLQILSWGTNKRYHQGCHAIPRIRKIDKGQIKMPMVFKNEGLPTP